MELGYKTTETDIVALVAAMRTRVKKLIIYVGSHLLEQKTFALLTQYRGDGECESISFEFYDNNEDDDIKLEDIKDWAASINWELDQAPD